VQIPLLDDDNPQFPDPRGALKEPDGLLAVGGNLQPQTLLSAYRSGIFPWYQDDDPILWWSPASRCLLPPLDLHCSKSLRKTLRRNDYQVTLNQAFGEVIEACSEPRDEDGGTWITEEMMAAYRQLNDLGQAHSVEVWFEEQLIGGLYGVAVGSLFCGESMFSRRASASKIAMAHLCRWGLESGLQLIDCQLVNPHLVSLGAVSIPRSSFLTQLSEYRDRKLNWPSPGSQEPPSRLHYQW
jgi:leucyl/phenylalanyl-tRNA--protein transferase